MKHRVIYRKQLSTGEDYYELIGAETDEDAISTVERMAALSNTTIVKIIRIDLSGEQLIKTYN